MTARADPQTTQRTQKEKKHPQIAQISSAPLLPNTHERRTQPLQGRVARPLHHRKGERERRPARVHQGLTGLETPSTPMPEEVPPTALQKPPAAPRSPSKLA